MFSYLNHRRGLAALLSIFLATGSTALEFLPNRSKESSYDSVSITQPAHEETIFDNNGDVEITVDISPPLRTDYGDQVLLFFDGLPLAKKQGTHFQLSGIDRGAHTLQAKIIDLDGASLASSEQVTFHMWQASKLFPNRRNW